MNTKQKKKVTLGVAFLLLTGLFAAIGQVAGAAVFFKLTDIPMHFLSLDALLTNWRDYQGDAAIKPYLQIGLGVSFAVAFIPLLLGVVLYIASKDKEEIHGSARWASDMDLAKSGLFPTERKYPTLLLGKMDKGRFKNRYVELDGQTFVGVSAPTGSGNGVGIVLPNLLNYSDSVVCTDIKLENFFKTAGFRQEQGQEVFLFAPDGYAVTEADRAAGILRSHRWNPFHYVRRQSEFRIGDVLVLSNALYPLSGKDDIWPQSAGKLFLGLSLWMLDTEEATGKTPTLPYLLSLTGEDGGLQKWMKRELKKGQDDPDHLGEECVREFNTFLSFPDETQGSILANFNAPLAIYGDETVARATSGNDFDFNDLRKRGISLFVGVQPPNLGRFKGLLNLFYEQLISENTRVIPELDANLTHQCLLLLDEFPALGRVNQVKTSIAFTRQYNLRYLLIYQDKAQLESKDLYDKEGADSIIENLATEVIYPPKKVNKRVEEICKTLGTKTVKVKSNSRNKGKHSSRGESTSLQKRPLMMEHELVELGHERHPNADIGLKVMLFKENQRSFIMNKIIYFEEDAFNERVAYSKANVPDIPLLNPNKDINHENEKPTTSEHAATECNDASAVA